MTDPIRVFFEKANVYIPKPEADKGIGFDSWKEEKALLRSGQPLSQQQCEILLDKLVRNACNSFETAQAAVYPTSGNPMELSSDPCGLTQSATLCASQSLGLKVAAFDIQEMLLDSPKGHVGLVIKLPTENGEKSFLFDPTYSQFCKEGSYTIKDPDPGFYLSQKPEIYSQLLTKGYIALDDDTAQAYLSSFRRGKETPNALSLLKNPPFSKYNYAYKPETLQLAGIRVDY